MTPSAVLRSTCSACWLVTAATLNSTADFSKWMLCCEVFLLGLKASVQGKLMRTFPFSLLMGKRVSMDVKHLKYLQAAAGRTSEIGALKQLLPQQNTF